MRSQHDTTFIDYKLAIGMLVVAGFNVYWENRQIINMKNEESMLPLYKDGSTWKVKRSAVEDLIENRFHLT
jgi:hypothetical protein